MLPLAPKLPNITCICFAKIPIPMAASIPCMADEGKKLLRDPSKDTENKHQDSRKYNSC